MRRSRKQFRRPFVAPRVARFVHAGMRAGFTTLDQIAPGLGAACAALLLRTPPAARPSAAERRPLSSGRHARVQFGKLRLATWRWGAGPVVVLVHGWGGHAGRMGGFVAPLVAAGLSPVAFDAPGHGRSGGLTGSVPEMADAVRALLDHFGPGRGVIAHSLGASAAALALRDGTRIPRAVFLAPPADLGAYVARFARRFKISDRMRRAMMTRLANHYGFSWSGMRVDEAGRGISTPLLIFHDVGDVCVPLSDGAAIARGWAGARLVRTRGLGHHRILRDTRVVQKAVEFLREALPIAVPSDARTARAV